MYQCKIDRERSYKRTLPIVLSVLVFLIGCVLLAYPTVSNWLSNRHQSELIVDYSDAVNDLDDADAEKELRRAERYNYDLADNVRLVDDPFRDDSGDHNELYTMFKVIHFVCD